MHPPESGFSTDEAHGERGDAFMRIKVEGIPPGGQPVAILCLGQVDAFYDAPMLESEGWDRRRAVADGLFENQWGSN